MRVLIAPDTFKECLSAGRVAEAMGRGVLSVKPDAVLDVCPLADGGEGTVTALVAATGGRFVTADVFGPLGAPIRARFALLGSPQGAALPGELGLSAAQVVAQGEAGGDAGATAVIEMAAASGLGLVPPDKRDPLRTTTYGTGQLILAALDAAARQMIIGVGGSATVDGGCGAAQALGIRFLDSAGRQIVPGMGGGALAQIDRIDASGLDSRLAAARIRVACDVTNPLTGPQGAAAVYGPQKGATDEMVSRLEANLQRLAALIRRDLGVDVEHLPGAGAAGGLAGGLVAFAGAMLEPGIELISRAVDLPRRLAAADLCITGEGRLDAQSASGKVVWGVARAAEAAGVPVVCIAGQLAQDAPAGLFAAVRSLVDADVSVRHAMSHADELITRRTGEAVRQLMGDG